MIRKVSRTDLCNPSNVVRERVRARFPELFDSSRWACQLDELIESVWFTGSNVWTAAYGLPATAGADWDVILVDELIDADEARDSLIEILGIRGCGTIPTHKKRPGSSPAENASDGICYDTPRGQLDIWSNEYGIVDALEEYRSNSHAHCRVAFNIKRGLIMLDNEAYEPPTANYGSLDELLKEI